MNRHGASAGVGFGMVMAMVISYAHLHSILWLMIHGLLGWFYVIYYIIFRPY